MIWSYDPFARCKGTCERCGVYNATRQMFVSIRRGAPQGRYWNLCDKCVLEVADEDYRIRCEKCKDHANGELYRYNHMTLCADCLFSELEEARECQ